MCVHAWEFEHKSTHAWVPLVFSLVDVTLWPVGLRVPPLPTLTRYGFYRLGPMTTFHRGIRTEFSANSTGAPFKMCGVLFVKNISNLKNGYQLGNERSFLNFRFLLNIFVSEIINLVRKNLLWIVLKFGTRSYRNLAAVDKNCWNWQKLLK